MYFSFFFFTVYNSAKTWQRKKTMEVRIKVSQHGLSFMVCVLCLHVWEFVCDHDFFALSWIIWPLFIVYHRYTSRLIWALLASCKRDPEVGPCLQCPRGHDGKSPFQIFYCKYKNVSKSLVHLISLILDVFFFSFIVSVLTYCLSFCKQELRDDMPSILADVFCILGN